MRITKIERRPLWWQSKGLHNGRCEQPSMFVITLEGEKRARRVYVRQLGNSGTPYVTILGLRYVLSDFPAVGDELQPWDAGGA